MRRISEIIVAVCLLSVAQSAQAAVKYSRASAGWSTASTWSIDGCIVGAAANTTVPVAADDVTICTGHTITTSANSSALSLVIQTGGTLTQATNRTLTIGAGGLSVTGTLTSQNTLTVAGTTSISGALNITSATGSKTFTGAVTINPGGTWSNTANEAVSMGGDLANSGTFTSGTSTYTFTGPTQWTGSDMTFAGPVVANSNVTVNVSGTVALANSITVTGTTSVTGTLSITSLTGAKTFTGDVTINSGGILSETVAELITYGGNVTINNGGTLTEFGAATMACAGNFQNDGTYTASTGVHTFSGATKTLSGVNPIVIPSVAVTGTYTNSDTLTVGTALSGAGSLTNTATLNIGGTSSITTLANAGTATITGAGAISTALANFTNSGTLNLNGTGTITGITNSGIINLATSGTITALTNNAAGTLNISATPTVPTITTLTATAAGNTVNYSGAGNQTVKATTYSNLGLSGSGAKAMGATAINGNFTLSGSATTAPTGALTVGGNFTIGVGTTFTAGALAHSVGGNWNNSGMFTAGTSTITLNGAVPQTIGGTSNTTFNNLTVNNANGVTLNSSPTVSGTLALTTGVVTAGSYTLRSSANCTTGVTIGTGYVSGRVELTFPAGNATCRFPVGSGSVYAPIDLTTPAGSTGGKMTGSTTGNEHPNVASSPVDSSKDVNRYWTLSGDTIGASTYVTTFNFVTGDVDIGASPGGFVLGRYASGVWSAPTPLTPFALSITATSLTGPINVATDFVAGEAGFVCSIPADSPVGTTCVCDNFNRVSLNPSTMFPGASWTVSTNSGSFGLPRIVNNKLRLTDNTGNVATAATAPGTYPAKGNWITVEFKHYAYNGTGADGIAFTLSDALITAAPGAFGGSLGYAPKTGINGFAGGWVGIGIDEYGNFSSNTEGRTGGAAPGLTLDSVAVRGSGSGTTGYPYLGGTATLTTPTGIDNAASTTPAYGYAYRLTVDARGYTWDGATGTKSTLVKVERDISGTGSNYSEQLVPSFDAYVVNPSQANVPTDWQLSFTGSTGGSTNIHEILGLKICAQTIVPPAGYRIQVDNMTPTTCPSDPQPTVTINPLNANGQVITNYTNTVTLAATLSGGGGGGASSATWVSQGTNQGIWDPINKRYTFAAGDNGVAKFTLSDLVQQNVYITVSEYLGTLTSSLAAPVYFSSGAASFVVSTPAAETLGTGVVAGRPHLMRISRNTVGCGGGTDVGFIGAKSLDGWYNPAAEHPTGANAPQICLPVSGACLPSYGSCQTLSIAPPVVDSGSNNLSLTFAAGVADFCLVTTDVGKYSLGLRDDSVATGTPAVIGTSTTLTARPFAVVVSGLTGNPGGTDYNGTVFTSAGTQFPATVGGYLWTSNGTTNQGRGDTGGDGVPDALATSTELTAGGLAPYYADTVILAAGATYTPAVPTGIAGALSNGSVSVTTGGTATATTLSYNEVGSFTLTATPAVSYLNSGVNLGPRVAIFSIPSSSSRNTWVGRFKPHHFGLAGSVVTRSDLQTTEGQATPFTYMDEPMKLSLVVTAYNKNDGVTQNYAGNFAKLDATTLGSANLANWICTSGTQCMGLAAISSSDLTARLAIDTTATNSANPSNTAWANGASTFTLYTKFARSGSPDGPYAALKFGAKPLDEDGVTLPPRNSTDTTHCVDLDVTTGAENATCDPGATEVNLRRKLFESKVRFGRLWLGNACGSDKRDLTIPFRAEYWNGSVFITNSDDSSTSIAKANIGLGNHQPTGFDGKVDRTHIPAGPFSVASGLGSFSLGKPPTGLTAAGSVDIVFALGADTTTNTTFTPAQPPTAGANLPYLRGKWYDTSYDRDPVARAAFGIYCGGGSGRGRIYLRESY